MKVLHNNPLGVLVGTIFLFVFSVGVFVLSMPLHRVAAEEVTLSDATEAGYVPPLEIHIANDGLVLLRSARVMAVDKDTLTVAAAWGAAEFTWQVRINARVYETHALGTRLLNAAGTPVPGLQFHTGDLVTITGMLDSGSASPTIAADSVRKLR